MSLLWIGSTVAIFYSITAIFGLAGNTWVLVSVWRSRQLAGSTGMKVPRDDASIRLRHYISLLAIVDTLVMLSLFPNIVFTAMPQLGVGNLHCQCIRTIDQLLRLFSLGCLACISLERYISIRRPFDSCKQRQFVLIFPLVILVGLIGALVDSVVVQASVMADTDTSVGCGLLTLTSEIYSIRKINSTSLKYPPKVARAASWFLSVTFLLFLATIATNYVQILLYVKRTFWQRRCCNYENQLRQLSVALLAPTRSNVHGVKTLVPTPALAALAKGRGGSGGGGIAGVERKLTPLPEPRYMRYMTATIMRIVLFHAMCWLPYCVLQLLPHQNAAGRDLVESKYTGRGDLDDKYNSGRAASLEPWLELVAGWLSFANSAGNWVFYAAMNRELRLRSKAGEEKRKRSAFSYSQQQNQQQQAFPTSVSGLVQRTCSFGLALHKQLNLGLRHVRSLNTLWASSDLDLIMVGLDGVAANNSGGNTRASPRAISKCSRATFKRMLSLSLDQQSNNGDNANKLSVVECCGADCKEQKRLYVKRKMASTVEPPGDTSLNAWALNNLAIAQQVGNPSKNPRRAVFIL